MFDLKIKHYFLFFFNRHGYSSAYHTEVIGHEKVQFTKGFLKHKSFKTELKQLLNNTSILGLLIYEHLSIILCKLHTQL